MRLRIRDSAVQLPQFVHVVQDVYEAEGEDADHVSCQRQQKQEEVAVVSPPDAVVHPGTVMVEVLSGEHQMIQNRTAYWKHALYMLVNTGRLSPLHFY